MQVQFFTVLLIDGRETNLCSGPKVFRRIIERHCRAGGVLSALTVAEITAKAASLRFDLLDRYQDEGWEVPDWIKQIPVLP
jgi:hypothetical protein